MNKSNNGAPAGGDGFDSAAMTRIGELGRIVLAGGELTRAQAMELCAVEGGDVYELFAWANRIRIRFMGESVRFCSIVAAKVGACSEDCNYCSQSKHFDTGVKPTKMTVEQMNAAADEAVANGASSFGIVNSGKGPTERELDWMEPFFKDAAENGKVRPCATLGELTAEQAKRLKDMGVLRINHNLESSRRNFPNICTTHTYDDRLETIRLARQAGLSICSGGIFGMGEDWQDRVDMALTLREVGVDVVPINFLNAIEGTPLYGKYEKLSPLEALKIVAIYRFILPGCELKIAGGREPILGEMQSWMFYAGGSSFLIGNYLTTFGRSAEDDHRMLKQLGLKYEKFDGISYEPEVGDNGCSETKAVSLPVVE